MRSNWSILYGIMLHWIWGIMLLYSTAPLNITAISYITKIGLVSASSAGMLYLLVSFLAVIGLVAPKQAGAIFLLPQQLLLILSACGAVSAMMTGTFADGTHRPIPFLIADQSPAILAAIFYATNVYTSYLSKYTRN